MAEFIIDPIAQEETEEAKRIIYRYFERLKLIEKGYVWVEDFTKKLENAYSEIQKTPYRCPICTLYPLNNAQYNLRYFTVGWFTAFYTCNSESATIWRVVSSRSDFSNIITIR